MKTKLTRISKRTLAIVLSVLMIFSTMFVSSIMTASAWGTGTYYCGNDIINQWDSNASANTCTKVSNSKYYYSYYLTKNDADVYFRFYSKDEYALGPEKNNTKITTDGSKGMGTYDNAWYFDTADLTGSNYYKVNLCVDPTGGEGSGWGYYEKTSIANMSPTLTASSSVTLGNNVTLSASLSGGSSSHVGTVTYKYEYKKSDSSVYTQIASTTSSSTSWKPSSAGTYSVRVTATDGGVIKGTNARTTRTETSSTKTITVTKPSHNVSFSKTGNGTLTVEDTSVSDSSTKTVSVKEGSDYTVKAKPDPGYKIKSLTIGGVSETAAVGKTDEYSVTKTMGKSAVTITAEFELAAQTKSLTYYVDLHSNTPSSTTNNPTIKFGSGNAVTLTREGTSTVYSAEVPTPYSPTTNQVVNPATITFNGHSYDVSIGDKDINDIKEVWIESRGTLDGTTTDNKFKVMSYASHVSTFTVTGGRFDDISTKLYGSEGSGDLDNVINGCGIITKNSDSSYTVKYAVEDADTEYGELKLRVSFTTTANNDYYFDGWYTGGEKSDRYTSADAEIWLDGKNYELSYVEKTTWNVKVVYNYDLYDNSEKMYYDADYAQENDQHKTYTVEGLTFIEQNGERMSEEDSRERVEHNAPNLINDYYEYALISVPKTTDPDGYTVEYNESDKTCTITANLKKTVRMYTVTLNGQQYGEKQSYQALVKIQSGEVLGFNDNQNLIWSDDDKDVATGTSYSFRVTGDMHITARENTTGETFNGKSIIAHRSFDVNTALKELVHNFYIADFYNDSVGGRDSYVQFYGGGVLYFAMDKTTGKPTKATGAVDETGEAIKGEIEKVVERVASGEDNDYLDDQPNVTDDQTKIVCRYLNFDGHPDLFKYSDELQAYQYIYSAGILNDKDYSNYSLRVYSYFIYYDENSNKYTISVSDDYADANMYEAGK